MYDVAMLACAAIAAIGAVLTVLPLLGFDLRIRGRQDARLEQIESRPKKRVWLALTLAVVSLGLSAGAFYYFFRPRAAEKTVEKPVASPCPEQQSSLEAQPIKPAKAPLERRVHFKSSPAVLQLAPKAGVQQSNSGGINVQQATAGENSPIINSPITVGDVPKRITQPDLAKITLYLRNAKFKSRIQISAFQNSNAIPFANDLYKAFKEAGWTMEDEAVNEPIGFTHPGQKKFIGVEILCKGSPIGPNEKVEIIEDEALYYVGMVLDSLKVPRVLVRNQNYSLDSISLRFTGIPD